MAPPAKKRKTKPSAAAPSSTRTTRSHRPSLSTELIGQITRFSCGNDVMNICVAVGSSESAVVRHSYLRGNYAYVLHALLKDVSYLEVRRETCMRNIRTWMGINTDWKKMCTAERMQACQDIWAEAEDGAAKIHLSVALVFNNPAVAIDLGLVEVLEFLIRERGVDVNSCQWAGLGSPKKNHLVEEAALLAKHPEDPCLRYLLSVQGVDLKANIRHDVDISTFHCCLLHEDVDARCFELIASHESIVDVNSGAWLRGSMRSPLQYSITWRVVALDDGHIDDGNWLSKFKVLIDLGADPNLTHGDIPSPIEMAKSESTKNPQDPVWKEVVDLMEGAGNIEGI